MADVSSAIPATSIAAQPSRLPPSRAGSTPSGVGDFYTVALTQRRVGRQAPETRAVQFAAGRLHASPHERARPLRREEQAMKPTGLGQVLGAAVISTGLLTATSLQAAPILYTTHLTGPAESDRGSA